MVKAYLRYEPVASLGCISSGNSIVYERDSSTTLITAALEKITIWNVRTGELVKQLSPVTSTQRLPEVTTLELSPDGQKLAAGHSDGTLRLWDIESGDAEPAAPGHHTGISVLRYSRNGALLASGGQDTSIVVWDITSLIPLHRLQGHTGQITSLVFVEADKILVSSSKDGYIRAWDLTSQHCFQTLSSHNGEVWGLDVHPDGTKLIAGYATPQLEVFSIQEGMEASTSGRSILGSLGTVQRSTPGRTAGLRFSPDGQVLACVGSGKALELYKNINQAPAFNLGLSDTSMWLNTREVKPCTSVFCQCRLRSEADALQKLKRRRKRKREKLSKGGQPEGAVEEGHDDIKLAAADILAPFQVVRCKSKIRGVAFPAKRAKTDAVHCALALANNSIEVWSALEDTTERLYTVDRTGHRGGVRALALSSDSSLLLSAAESSIKVWNPNTLADIRSIPVENGLCLMFAPGNRHAVVGTKDGRLEVLDIGAGECVSSIDAHKGPVWAVTPLPDNSGLVSGSADHEAKFWEWEVKEQIQEGAQPKRTLSLRYVRTVKMSDDILAVKISPDGRLLALSLLDSTIQILFLDTLKLKGSLYGHKLPVLTMDISSDSTLLVSGSADKNIKIWGLDFNDCHKSIFAHDDSIMQVAFVPNTHYAFTVGKDRLLKYWDLDRWELLLDLPSHHAEVWCLAISSLGDMVVTGSADRTVRIWERTDEPFFAEEEKENRIESLFEAEGPNPHTAVRPEEGSGPAEGKAVTPGLESASARVAMDDLADALEAAEKEIKRLEEYETQHPQTQAPVNPLLLGMSPAQYVLRSLANIRSADLEQAVLLLPFSHCLALLDYLCYWLEKGSKVELACRVAVLIVQLHHSQLISTPSVRPVLLKTRELLQREIKKKRDMLGFNAAGVLHLQRLLKQRRQKLV